MESTTGLVKRVRFLLFQIGLVGALGVPAPGATASPCPLTPALIGTTACAGSAHQHQGSITREAYLHGVVVRVVHGRLFRATNGVDWSDQSVPTPSFLRDVAAGDGLFVAVGDEGALVTSRDGVRWTLRDSATDERL